MAEHKVVKATHRMLEEFLPTLRVEERIECACGSGMSTKKGMEITLDTATEAWAWISPTGIAAIFGVIVSPRKGCAESVEGSAFCCCGKEAWKYTRTLLKGSRYWLKRWHTQYDFEMLSNAIMASKQDTLRWLKRIGFVYTLIEEGGVARVPFYHVMHFKED